MDTETLSRRIAGCARSARGWGPSWSRGHGLSSEEAFALAGAAQVMANAADAVVAVAGAWGARVETTVRSGRGSGCIGGVRRRDGATRHRLATGLTEGVAGRKAALGAAVGERFPGA